MLRFLRYRLLRLGRREEGAAAVEFAICLIPLVLIVGGIIDFGQMWYMQSVLATASREGARYAVRYQTNSDGNRLAPSQYNPTVQNYITEKYGPLFSYDQDFNVSEPDPNYDLTVAKTLISVTVTANKSWFFLNNFIPTLPNPKLLSSTTVMSLE